MWVDGGEGAVYCNLHPCVGCAWADDQNHRYKARDVTNESIVALKKIPLLDVDEGVPSTVWTLPLFLTISGFLLLCTKKNPNTLSFSSFSVDPCSYI